MWFTAILVLGLLQSTTSSRHDDTWKRSSSPAAPSPWNERRHRRARDDGTCELEIHCAGGGAGKGDGPRTSTSGVVRLPIRGLRGPPGTPG